ncbi:MAG: hypothetical protein GEV10_15200 [Streptosporangiales bacterium]|nr:hypothetical protein [Streptosporangiales bacterium]
MRASVITAVVFMAIWLVAGIAWDTTMGYLLMGLIAWGAVGFIAAMLVSRVVAGRRDEADEYE